MGKHSESTPFDFEALWASMPPSERRNQARRLKVFRIQHEMFMRIPWMRAPILNYVYSFWNTLMDEGIRNTLKPRWGAITFGWLNDGIKPTVWHTWRQLTHSHADDKYTGLWTDGAPHSKKEADERLAKHERERGEYHAEAKRGKKKGKKKK